MSKTKDNKIKYIRSPIPYMGNKYKLLPQILPLFPSEQPDYFLDAFGGSAVVSMNYKGATTIYNELDPRIFNLVQLFHTYSYEELDAFFKNRIKEFNLIHIKDPHKQIADKENYYKYRDYYNSLPLEQRDPRDLYLLSMYSINQLIRFNRSHEFNASAGTNRYRSHKIEDALSIIKDMHIFNYSIFDKELLNFLEHAIKQGTVFVYFDPPYSNTTAVYNEARAFEGAWTIEHDYKLFELLDYLDKLGIKWALSNVFKSKERVNQHLIDWCTAKSYYVHYLNINYHAFNTLSNKAEEVLITNYVNN